VLEMPTVGGARLLFILFVKLKMKEGEVDEVLLISFI